MTIKINKELRKLGITAMLLIPVELILFGNYPLSVLAQETSMNVYDRLCYMQTEKGEILNLEHLCKPQKAISQLSKSDQKFIEEYKGLLKSYPKAQVILAVIVEQNPEFIISRAASACNSLRTGKLDERIYQAEVDIDILNAIAPQYYCPEFND